MATAKIAITIDDSLLAKVDSLVAQSKFPSRSRVIQEAIRDKVRHSTPSKLERECVKLDPQFEQQLAEEGSVDTLVEWPPY